MPRRQTQIQGFSPNPFAARDTPITNISQDTLDPISRLNDYLSSPDFIITIDNTATLNRILSDNHRYENILDYSYREYVDNLPLQSERVLDRNNLNDDSVSLVLENPNENFTEIYKKNIEKLKGKDISTECIICMEDDCIDIVYLLCCNNSVCFECISQWISENDSCPHCRSKSPPIHDLNFLKNSEILSLAIDN